MCVNRLSQRKIATLLGILFTALLLIPTDTPIPIIFALGVAAGWGQGKINIEHKKRYLAHVGVNLFVALIWGVLAPLMGLYFYVRYR